MAATKKAKRYYCYCFDEDSLLIVEKEVSEKLIIEIENSDFIIVKGDRYRIKNFCTAGAKLNLSSVYDYIFFLHLSGEIQQQEYTPTL